MTQHTPPARGCQTLRCGRGRAFGGIVLAAFLLYGIGSAAADRPIGMAFVVVNSFAVAFAGLIGFRLVRSTDHSVGVGYVAARMAEAVLLAGGIILAEFADVSDADNAGYLLAMIALSAGSIPFCRTLGRRRWIPQPLATWGIVGYAALGVGALSNSLTDRSVTVVLRCRVASSNSPSACISSGSDFAVGPSNPRRRAELVPPGATRLIRAGRARGRRERRTCGRRRRACGRSPCSAS